MLFSPFSDSINVDVQVEAALDFGGLFATSADSVDVPLQNTTYIECTARGGYPDPDVTAYLGKKNLFVLQFLTFIAISKPIIFNHCQLVQNVFF